MKTTQMTAAEIAERTARFSALQPMSTMKDNTRVSQAAKDIIFARKIMPIVHRQDELLARNRLQRADECRREVVRPGCW